MDWAPKHHRQTSQTKVVFLSGCHDLSMNSLLLMLDFKCVQLPSLFTQTKVNESMRYLHRRKKREMNVGIVSTGMIDECMVPMNCTDELYRWMVPMNGTDEWFLKIKNAMLSNESMVMPKEDELSQHGHREIVKGWIVR